MKRAILLVLLGMFTVSMVGGCSSDEPAGDTAYKKTTTYDHNGNQTTKSEKTYHDND